jgi:hypothetical protein
MLIGVICVCALPDNSGLFKSIRKREIAHRYCGKNLVNILKLLCRGQYYGLEEERKRSIESNPRTVPRGTVYRTSPNKRRGSFFFQKLLLRKEGSPYFWVLKKKHEENNNEFLMLSAVIETGSDGGV